jgi:L-ascorbate metabolism protein UlaG (beta-lactamase superfamily)
LKLPYPESDHYDGEKFFNPEPMTRRASGKRLSIFAILRARMRKDPEVWAIWPKHVENKPYPAPSGVEPAVTFIGHSSFLLRLPGLTILTDPVFSKRCSPVSFAGPKRVRAPGLAIKALPQIDIILLSHNHYDHMDLASLRKIRRRFPKAAIVSMLGNGAYLARKRLQGAVELDWWQSMRIGEATITATPARHFSARTLWDKNEMLWGGFWISHGGRSIYFAGDTGYTKFFKEIRARLGAPDLALLPIGAYEPRWFMGVVHMNPADAVMAFQDLEAKRAIGMHFGTFQLTAEAIDAPVHDLAAARAAAGMPDEDFLALDVGESVIFTDCLETTL